MSGHQTVSSYVIYFFTYRDSLLVAHHPQLEPIPFFCGPIPGGVDVYGRSQQHWVGATWWAMATASISPSPSSRSMRKLFQLPPGACLLWFSWVWMTFPHQTGTSLWSVQRSLYIPPLLFTLSTTSLCLHTGLSAHHIWPTFSQRPIPYWSPKAQSAPPPWHSLTCWTREQCLVVRWLSRCGRGSPGPCQYN